ncbi:MAG: transglutaminase domain-containing protein [Chloroflexaceae bacterium]|nr:transglutaminase domain-containing protein [Chloroflexaceae bacterium]
MTTDTISQRERPWVSQVSTALPAALLAILMQWAVVQSIAGANWADDLGVIVLVGVGGAVLGALFAHLRWLPPLLAHLLSALLGLVLTVRQLAPLMGERLTTWADQATELFIRTLSLVRTVSSGGRGEDILLFIASLALLSWLLGYASAWLIFRRGWVWRMVLLNAFIILTNYTYTLPKPTLLFFVFLVAALLLVVLQQVVQRQERWAAAQMEYPDFLPMRFVASAALVCTALIAITSVLPSQVSVSQATATWNALKQPFVLARERWEDLFSTINAPPGTSGNSFALRGSGLGGARSLGDATVMYVAADNYDYWRAVARDRYTSEGWLNTTGEQARAVLGANSPEQARTPFGADVDIPRTEVRERRVVTQTVTLKEDRKDNLITVGGEALRITLPTAVEHSYLTGQNSRRPNLDDVSLVVANDTLRAGLVYTVTALASNADVQSLREAGTSYPAWVQERYLQLPDTITPRTIELARQIVQQANALTPYDQAVAIQSYLRALPYNEQINAPPPGVDPVDYFLFDVREGYCDYYASAMALMLRSLNVPTRFAQGYAGGFFDPELGVYVVRQNVAHSWPEVYFPGFGWERFEPTPASYTSLPLRPETPEQAGPDGALGAAGDDDNLPNDPDRLGELDPGLPIDPSTGEGGSTSTPANSTMSAQVWQTLGLIGAVLAALALVAGVLALAWLWELRGLSNAARAYAQLALLGRWAGFPQQPHTTPLEYSTTLSRAMPFEREAIQRVVGGFIAERYQKTPTPASQFESDLRQIRGSMLREGLRRLVRFGDREVKH